MKEPGMGKSVVVSLKAIKDLEKQLATHDRTIFKAQQKRAELVKRIDAMKTLLGATTPKATAKDDHTAGVTVSVGAGKTATLAALLEQIKAQTQQIKAAAAQQSSTASEAEVSLPDIVVEVLTKRGPLTAVEIRSAVVEAGVKREKLGATYSYLYTVLGRLVQRGRVQRYRGKYQLPIDNSVVVQPAPAEVKVSAGSPTVMVR
jgi:chromosome segregation ATPase